MCSRAGRCFDRRSGVSLFDQKVFKYRCFTENPDEATSSYNLGDQYLQALLFRLIHQNLKPKCLGHGIVVECPSSYQQKPDMKYLLQV